VAFSVKRAERRHTGGVTVDRISSSTISRRWRVVAAVVSMTFVVLVAGGWWASQQGYVSWFGTACTDEGYDPVPSYDELVTEYKKSPYCARRIRDETWF
jgi:hypothetical protein